MLYGIAYHFCFLVEHGYAQTKQLVSKRTKYSISPHTSSNACTQPINDVPKATNPSEVQLGIPKLKLCIYIYSISDVPRVIDPKHVQFGTSKFKCTYTYVIRDVPRATNPKHLQLGTPKLKCIYTYTISDVPKTIDPKRVQLGTPKGKSTLGCIKKQ